MKERYVDVRRGGVRRGQKRVEESIDASDMERWGGAGERQGDEEGERCWDSVGGGVHTSLR